ncbi:BatD family protein [Luteimonas vadosa]|uniref:BatD family protein n=1 Tax=Luteimonas vadosa TaxID=1165507 RepID=A0ABP9DTW6_9GAMM
MTRMLRALLLLLAITLPCLAQAQSPTRAWLDRDRIAMGETTTLNIETGQPNSVSPDYAPLQADFSLEARSSRQSYEATSSGGARVRTLFAVALRPRREGVVTIPSLQVGNQRTEPVQLTVLPAVPARAGGDVFIEVEVDHEAPYVQQAVGYVVRLYYATQLVSGELDQEAPDGASLQRIGNDVQFSRDLGGRRYNVVERRFLLIPERSGTLAMPPARFQGRGVGGFFDDLFGDGRKSLSANGPRRVFEVRPVPADAPQPWLPLHGLSLRYMETPQEARAGEALTVVVEAHADGGNAAQLPELTLPVGDGAQVFAEPPQVDETFDRGRPQVRVTRKFSVVPAQAGALRLPGPRMAWWDVRAGRARTASLPDIALQVSPAADAPPGGASPVAASGERTDAGAGADRWVRVPGVQGEVRLWAVIAAGFALLWLATLAWGLHRRPGPAPADAPAKPPGAVIGKSRGAGMPALKHALDAGTLGDVAETLCAMATPPAADVDVVRARLADPDQVAAVEALQRARWAGGDGVVARQMLRRAFAKGPRWQAADAGARPLLPPLYPPAGTRSDA